MSPRTTRTTPDDGSRPRRPPAKKQNGATAGLLFALAVVAIGAAGWLNRAKLSGSSSASDEGGANAKQVESPFASIPEELPPVRGGGGGSAKAMTSRAPASLLQEPVWTAALEASKGAYLLAQEAEEAKRAANNAKYLKKAVAAREAFDQVIIDTAVWEEELVQQYGDNDQVVSQIMRERQRWFGFLRKYHGLRDE